MRLHSSFYRFAKGQAGRYGARHFSYAPCRRSVVRFHRFDHAYRVEFRKHDEIDKRREYGGHERGERKARPCQTAPEHYGVNLSRAHHKRVKENSEYESGKYSEDAQHRCLTVYIGCGFSVVEAEHLYGRKLLFALADVDVRKIVHYNHGERTCGGDKDKYDVVYFQSFRVLSA